MSVERLVIGPGEACLDALPALSRMLDGNGPVLVPAAGWPDLSDSPTPSDPVDGPGLAIGTSGSTGTPKLALLRPSALVASAAATQTRLGGPGQWLLTLPPAHIAGIQVLLRSLQAGTTPVVMPGGHFDAASFAEATGRLRAARTYVSLVPTQLSRLLSEPAGREALAAYDVVLVGGAATRPDLLESAREVTTVVTTYGMSETCGGCVYDGLPLDGVTVDTGSGGRVRIAGPVLAEAYLGDPARTESAFPTIDGVRSFVTDDLGTIDNGRLSITGRIDDVILTGGLKVLPAVVEQAIEAALPGTSAIVVGIDDKEWGQRVGAVIAGGPRPPLNGLRDRLGALPAAARPTLLRYVDALPLRGPGKPDRSAALAMLMAAPGDDRLSSEGVQ